MDLYQYAWLLFNPHTTLIRARSKASTRYCLAIGLKRKRPAQLVVLPGAPVTPKRVSLPLLPSDPGGVRSLSPHRTRQHNQSHWANQV